MIETKAELARRLDALHVGQPLTDCWFLLKRLFGRNGQLDARGIKAARAFAARHNCILSYPEFSREPVLFEKLSPDGQLEISRDRHNVKFCHPRWKKVRRGLG